MTTLAEVQADIVLIRAAIAAAEHAVSYSQGDRTAVRQRITDLELRLARLARSERELTAVGSGANSGGLFVTPSWK